MTDDSEKQEPRETQPEPAAKQEKEPPKKAEPPAKPEQQKKSDRATLLILLNILAITIFLVLTLLVVRWPQMSNDHVDRIAQAATEEHTQQYWMDSARSRAEEADKAVERYRTVAIVYYVFGAPVAALLLANAWYLFIYRRRLGKARKALTNI